MDHYTYIPDNRTYVPRLGTLKGAIILIGMMVLLSIGIALASPAHGAALSQNAQGDITGAVTVNGQGAAGIAVELRQRANGGDDKTLATATTDATGTYHFANQPSAPNDAFFYIRFTGSKGDLAAWYSFPIIYLSGSEVTVPGVELGDVELIAPGQDVSMALPGNLRWKARKMGETYRVFVYASGKNDKAVLDSGSLGTGTEFPIPEGGLPAGKYEAVVQVRDVVAGYGQSRAHFRFTIGAPPAQSGTITAAPGSPEGNASTGAPASGQGTGSVSGAPPTQPKEQGAAKKPNLKVNLSADKTTVSAGESITYKLEVENSGAGQAAGLVLTDKLPAGASVDASRIKASAGQVSLTGGTVTVNMGDLAPGSKASVEIPVSVSAGAGTNLSNQASALYNGASDAVLSNAYVAQVAAPISGPPEAQSQQPAQQPAAPQKAPAANPQASQPQQAPAAPKAAPATNPQARPATAPAKKPSAPMPQTGGAFPVVLAVILVLITILARYLRGLAYRRI